MAPSLFPEGRSFNLWQLREVFPFVHVVSLVSFLDVLYASMLAPVGLRRPAFLLDAFAEGAYKPIHLTLALTVATAD